MWLANEGTSIMVQQPLAAKALDVEQLTATIGRIRLSATTKAGPLEVDPLTATQRALVAMPVAQRTPEQTRQLFT